MNTFVVSHLDLKRTVKQTKYGSIQSRTAAPSVECMLNNMPYFTNEDGRFYHWCTAARVLIQQSRARNVLEKGMYLTLIFVVVVANDGTPTLKPFSITKIVIHPL